VQNLLFVSSYESQEADATSCQDRTNKYCQTATPSPPKHEHHWTTSYDLTTSRTSLLSKGIVYGSNPAGVINYVFFALPLCGIYFLLAHMKAKKQTQLPVKTELEILSDGDAVAAQARAPLDDVLRTAPYYYHLLYVSAFSLQAFCFIFGFRPGFDPWQTRNFPS
jgi:hypothetical protein